MKGRAIFATVPGEQPPPSTDPIALLNYALQRHPESVRLVNFAGSVRCVDHHNPDPEDCSAEITVPSTVAENLLLPAEDQDAYVLIHIPRAVVDEMDSPVERPLIVLPPGVRRPS